MKTLVFAVVMFLAAQAVLGHSVPEADLRTELFYELSRSLDKKFLDAVFPKLEPCYTPKDEYYERVMDDSSIKRGLSFLRRHRAALESVSRVKKYRHVDAISLVAVLRVESDFGNYLGVCPVPNSLYRVYLDMPHWRRVALKNLKIYFQLAHKYNWDVFSILGSSMGAFGFPQFLPESYEPYAVDGDADGKIDLFKSWPDIFFSTANYLVENGWTEHFNGQSVALLHYNHAGWYRDLILRYRDALREAKGGAP